MAQTNFKKAISEYKVSVKKMIPAASFFVFGSVAKKKTNPDSDVDMIVVSSSFQTMSGMDRLTLLSKLRVGAARKVPMDIIGFTPQEMKDLKKSKNFYWKGIFSEMQKI